VPPLAPDWAAGLIEKLAIYREIDRALAGLPVGHVRLLYAQQ